MSHTVRADPALIEKPLAATSAGAARLAGAFAAASLRPPSDTWNASTLPCKPYGAVWRPVPSALSTRSPPGVRGPPPERVGDTGVLQDLAVHDLDATGWLTGQPYTALTAHTLCRPGGVHDDMAALADGTLANHLVNVLSR